jgi:SpoVK/Ycf46/Vps4 family AAA+-type ATPase
MVNELLQQMESFRGVLICATNNDQSLDGAAFRRFSVKVRFNYLKEEGRRIFWRKFFPEVDITEAAEGELSSMNCLAPGDFHAVANRFRFQKGVTPTADEDRIAIIPQMANFA